MVDSILNKQSEDSQLIRDQLMEEFKAKMMREQEEARFERENRVRDLNEQRMKFVEAERTVAEKKYVHQEVMRRGLDFLTQVELGKAPPLEYAVRNIQATRDTSLLVGDD